MGEQSGFVSESWSQYLPVELYVVQKKEDDEIAVWRISITDSDAVILHYTCIVVALHVLNNNVLT